MRGSDGREEFETLVPRRASTPCARTGSSRPSRGRACPTAVALETHDLRGPRRRPHPPARASASATPSRAGTPGCAAAWRSASTTATPRSTGCWRRARSDVTPRVPGRPPRGGGRGVLPAGRADHRLVRPGTRRRLDRPRRRRPPGRLVPRVPVRRRRRAAGRPVGRRRPGGRLAAPRRRRAGAARRARRRGVHPPLRRPAPARRRGRPVLHLRRLHALLGPGPRHRPGAAARRGLRRPDARRACGRSRRCCATRGSTAPPCPCPTTHPSSTG